DKASLFERMKESLERHPADRARTMFLDGKAVAAALSGALQERVPGAPWYEDRFQRGLVTDEQAGSLVILATRETLDSDRRGAVHITLTTHGLDDDTFAITRQDWWSWWSYQVDCPELTVRSAMILAW
ncbi:MAG: hypothetical protein ACRD0V_16900, partial [Acidimicrobiales bacterium]